MPVCVAAPVHEQPMRWHHTGVVAGLSGSHTLLAAMYTVHLRLILLGQHPVACPAR